MTLKELQRHYYLRSSIALEQELKIRKEVVKQFLAEFHLNNYIPDWHSLIPLSIFVKEHPEFQEYFYCLLDSYHFYHNTAISNTILYSFYLPQDAKKIHYRPENFPFIENVCNAQDYCTLSVDQRIYYFQKASEIFQKKRIILFFKNLYCNIVFKGQMNLLKSILSIKLFLPIYHIILNIVYIMLIYKQILMF